jgi:hypothetical protein
MREIGPEQIATNNFWDCSHLTLRGEELVGIIKESSRTGSLSEYVGAEREIDKQNERVRQAYHPKSYILNVDEEVRIRRTLRRIDNCYP